MPEKKFCKMCGAALKPGAQFCGKCGAPVSQKSNTDRVTVSGKPPSGQNRQANLKKWLPLIIIVVAVIILIAVILIVRNRRNQEDVYMDYSYTEEETYTENDYAEEEPYTEDDYDEEEFYAEGGADDDLYVKYGILSGNDFTDDELVYAAKELYTKLYQAAYSSYDEYADLIIGGTKEEIEDFQWGYFLSSAQNFDKIFVTIVFKEDPYYLVQVDAFLVQNNYSGSDVTSLDQKYLMSYTSDGWKINYTEEALDFVNSSEILEKRYPDGMVDALEAGRNAEAMDRCYLWLNEKDEFDDMVCADTLFLWQNADGSVDAMIWFGNGTNQIKTINEEHLTVTDEELGDIIDFDLSTAGESVGSSESMLKTIHINAEDVTTGTQAWTNIDVNLSVDYDTSLDFSWLY